MLTNPKKIIKSPKREEFSFINCSLCHSQITFTFIEIESVWIRLIVHPLVTVCLCGCCGSSGVSATFAVKLFKSWIYEKDINCVASSLRKVGMDNRLMVGAAAVRALWLAGVVRRGKSYDKRVLSERWELWGKTFVTVTVRNAAAKLQFPSLGSIK